MGKPQNTGAPDTPSSAREVLNTTHGGDRGGGGGGGSGRQCRICRNKDPEAAGEQLLAVGCKCFAAVHLTCAIKAAQANEAMWMRCSKCEQRWGTDLDQGLLAAAPEPPEQAAGTCRVCQTVATDRNQLLSCGCACRGTVAQPIHLACATQLAEEHLKVWCFCPTCDGRWGGDLKPLLAQQRCRAFADRPGHDSERLSAELDLSKTLRLQGKVDEALRIGSEAFRTFTDGRQALYLEQLAAEASAASVQEDEGCEEP